MQYWISATIGLAIAALLLLYFVRRKPISFDAVAPRNRVAMIANGDPNDVLNAVCALARNSEYTLGVRDDANKRIVLQEGFSFFNYGSLFQIVVMPDGPDKSSVHVAIVGKGYQWGPAFQRSKRNFLKALQKAIGGTFVTT
ncbi:hypothetical protein [Pseudorhodoplanes sinuspersici]|uniref:Uncharacterized protein n=1 Tax=Pseudorhodoplanes sinuspersici TaxID=1235591 RepID=A0A1W6ZTF6_9HYPH|nr:hypothetical protein [Pseudorhodoplanes sinuspersici]ARQ00401.1 hypothetical protein CAK95_15925 [Pseudorhodoplanes sinuspersici]RKE67434.1 hypothetical protein DFP91_5198 [Pseudorhodoplanes sinuspersici]